MSSEITTPLEEIIEFEARKSANKTNQASAESFITPKDSSILLEVHSMKNQYSPYHTHS